MISIQGGTALGSQRTFDRLHFKFDAYFRLILKVSVLLADSAG
jgi:hypothetical protein